MLMLRVPGCAFGQWKLPRSSRLAQTHKPLPSHSSAFSRVCARLANRNRKVVTQGAALAPGTPEALFQTHMPSFPLRPQYDVSRDGRFLIDTEAENTSAEPIHLLQNWRPPAK